VVAARAAKYARREDQQYLPGADPDFDVVFMSLSVTYQ
jgi:hypothetical protein